MCMLSAHTCHPAGKLHFVKFETAKIDQMLEFIEAKGLHKLPNGGGGAARIKATGGGAFKFAQLFEVRHLHTSQVSNV